MKSLSLLQVGGVIWRRRWWVVAPALIGALLGTLALMRWKPVYRASTLVLVEPQKVPENYVRATVTTSLQDRLKTIEQQINNRSNLEQVIREVGLYPELVATGQMSEAVEAARRSLALEVQGTRVFRVYFKGPDPQKVADTANRLTDLFIEQSLRQRRTQAEGTASFLSAQLATIKQQLEEHEGRIASFKQQNLSALPEQRETNLRAIEQLQSKLEINLNATDKAEARLHYLQRETRPLAVAPSTPSRLQEARTELANLLSRYTEAHPAVIEARAQVAQLERELSGVPQAAPAAPDPLLQSELAAVRRELDSLAAERVRTQQDIAVHRARLEHTPQVELELLDLSRDYENLRQSYDTLLDKKLEAELAESLEQRQQGEHFAILESAVPPQAPFSPSPRLLLALGIALGATVGVGLALLRNETDNTCLDGAALRRAFPGVRLLAEIPSLPSPDPKLAAASPTAAPARQEIA